MNKKSPRLLLVYESIFLSRVEGRGFHVEGEGTMSRVKGNIFFPIFFFLKGNNRCRTRYLITGITK